MKQGSPLTTSKLAILSAAIALMVATPAWGCGWKKQAFSRVQWWHTPWAMLLTVPGMALAAGLYSGGRVPEQQE